MTGSPAPTTPPPTPRHRFGWLWFLPRLVWRGLRGLVWLVCRVLTSFRFWVLVGLSVLAALAAWSIVADRYTPLTTDAFVQAFVVQVAPQVEGQVARVHVREDDRVHKGDPLFELDVRPFDHEVARLEAKLADAIRQADQLATDLEAARAEHERLTAEGDLARAVYDQEDRIFKRESTTERKYLEALGRHKAARAAVEHSARLVRKAEQSLDARIGADLAIVAAVRAELASARLRREWAQVTAPVDGVVTELQLRPGAYARAGQPVLTIIDESRWFVVANFREGSLERVRAGQPAIVCFGHFPGRLFPAEVESLAWGVGQGQGVPSGQLPSVPPTNAWVRPAQRFPVRLRLAEEPPSLRVGMTATVSVYAETEGRLPPITRAVHQLLAWLDYLD